VFVWGHVEEEVHAAGAAEVEFVREFLVGAWSVTLFVEPVVTEDVAGFAGEVVLFAFDLPPFHVGRRGRRLAFDGDQIRRPGIINGVGRAVADAVVHHDKAVGLQGRNVPIEKLAVAAAQDARDVHPQFGDGAVAGEQFGDLAGLEILVTRGGESFGDVVLPNRKYWRYCMDKINRISKSKYRNIFKEFF